jgi:hypothetical protein
VTHAHTKEAAHLVPPSWDTTQVGVLDGVALTLIAGDYCGFDVCGTDGGGPTPPRTDDVVPVYSQLLQPWDPDTQGGPPPKNVYLPPGMVPATGVTRATFPTVHSPYQLKFVDATPETAVINNPPAVEFLVQTVRAAWAAAGARTMARP